MRNGSSRTGTYTGGPELFYSFVSEHGFDYIKREVEPFMPTFPHWIGVGPSRRKIDAVTPYRDDMERNRRIKPSSEITPFSVSRQAARILINRIDGKMEMYPPAERICDIRIPVEETEFTVGVADALSEAGYIIEAINPNLYTINGKNYTVNDFGKTSRCRLAVFPQRQRFLARVFEDVIWNPQVRPFSLPALRERIVSLSDYEIRRARIEDSEGIVSLLERTFPVYETCNLRETMPRMIADTSPIAPVVYAAVRKSDNSVVATCTNERNPFHFAELTDVASDANGLGTTICYLSLVAARELYGVRNYWSDDVSHPSMNRVSKQLGAVFSGIHPVQVKITTRQFQTDPNPVYRLTETPRAMDLFVWTGSTDFERVLV
ncbi:MAG: hypothetical protein HY362_00885 [Candidatus Aenigmarchaeota archaeon]|nr:hypothetical protein [Candidatus Aenigmarchaeota archaeon]